MKTRIVRIGNSQGIRIPKPLLDQAGLAPEAEVEVEAEAGHLVIRAATPPRHGWSGAFAAMAAAGDDQPLEAAATRFDETEWEW